jgi:hypothetical protein
MPQAPGRSPQAGLVADSHHPFNLEFSQDVSSRGYLGSSHGLKVPQAASLNWISEWFWYLRLGVFTLPLDPFGPVFGLDPNGPVGSIGSAKKLHTSPLCGAYSTCLDPAGLLKKMYCYSKRPLLWSSLSDFQNQGMIQGSILKFELEWLSSSREPAPCYSKVMKIIKYLKIRFQGLLNTSSIPQLLAALVMSGKNRLCHRNWNL